MKAISLQSLKSVVLYRSAFRSFEIFVQGARLFTKGVGMPKPTPPTFYTREDFFKRWGALGGVIIIYIYL